MAERKSLWHTTSSDIDEGQFILARIQRDIKNGDTLEPEDIEFLLASPDGSAADILMALGIARGEACKGKNTVLITNPNQKIVYPRCDDE